MARSLLGWIRDVVMDWLARGAAAAGEAVRPSAVLVGFALDAVRSRREACITTTIARREEAVVESA